MNELHAISPDLPCDVGPGVVVVDERLGEVVIVEVKLVAAGCAHRQEEDKCLHAGTLYMNISCHETLSSLSLSVTPHILGKICLIQKKLF